MDYCLPAKTSINPAGYKLICEIWYNLSMLLSIITLNYKKVDLTINCLKSLYARFSSRFGDNTIELIIVDNASGDGSVEILRKTIHQEKYKNIHVSANSENAGFGKGCNFGAKTAKGKYILFLNNDTLIKDKGILDMVSFLDQHPEVAILGGQLCNMDGSRQCSTENFYTLLSAFMLLIGFQRYKLIDSSPKAVNKVDWVKGGFFMIRADVFHKLKGFDENIFMYTEDMELCYRAATAKYATYFYPHAKALHVDQGSSNRSFAIINIYENLLYFYKKHRSNNEYIFIKTMLKAKALFLYTIGRIFKNTYLSQTYEKALKVF